MGTFSLTLRPCAKKFSNIIGYGMSLLNGRAGLEGWRWIFLLFGIITIALGILALFLIVDFPDKNTFLTPAETKIILDRINVDRNDAVADKLTAKVFLKHLIDFKIWIFGLCFCFSTMPAYAFSCERERLSVLVMCSDLCTSLVRLPARHPCRWWIRHQALAVLVRSSLRFRRHL